MGRFLLASSFALVGLVIAGCGSDKQVAVSDSIEDDTPTVTVQPEVTSTSAFALPSPTYVAPIATPDAETPEFWMRIDRKGPPGYLTVVVPTTPSTEGFDAIVEDVQALRKRDGGGWFVNIDCGHGMDATGGTRVATAKFALDNLGAAQTGLAVGGSQIEVNPGARCD